MIELTIITIINYLDTLPTFLLELHSSIYLSTIILFVYISHNYIISYVSLFFVNDHHPKLLFSILCYDFPQLIMRPVTP